MSFSLTCTVAVHLLRSLKLITTFIAIVIIPLGTIIAFRNYESASNNITTSVFGQGGTVTVYGVAQNQRGNGFDMNSFGRAMANNSGFIAELNRKNASLNLR